MPIVWRDQMSVHNTIIDDEHKYLICLINTVELILTQPGEHKELLLTTLEQLLSYTQEHFSREEQLQLKIEYPHYLEHRLEHQQISEELQEIYQRLKQMSPAAVDENARKRASEMDIAPDIQQGSSNSIVMLLRHWIIDHVLQTDAKMRRYLEPYPRNYL